VDVRAFGSVYGQTAALPYSSGFGYIPASGRVNFPACRAVFIQADTNANKLYLSVELTDAPGQVSTASNLQGDQLIPISCTAIISGNSPGVFVLY
jgi:hypothetical protein